MDAYKRVEMALNFEEPDRIPIYQMFDSLDVVSNLGGIGSFPENVKNCCENLGIDACAYYPIPGRHWIQDNLNLWQKHLGIDPSEWHVVDTGETTWISKRPFEDLDGLTKHIPLRPNMNDVAEDFLKWYVPSREALAPTTVLFGNVFGCVGNSLLYCGAELFYEAVLVAPEVVKSLFEVFGDVACAVTSCLAENDLGPACHIAEDIAHTTSLLLPPAFLREMLFPQLERIIEPLKRKGIKAIYHSDGDLSLILDSLVNELAIDGLHPVEPVPGMNILKIRERFPRLVLCGGMDYVNLITKGDPADTEKESERLICGLGPGGGYLFGASSAFGTIARVENIRAMLRAAENCGRYPIHSEREQIA
jgi:hypothetical protein